MTTMTIPAFEPRTVRLFNIDLDPQEAAGFADASRDAAEASPLTKALGVTRIEPRYVEVINVKDLGEMGIAGYLTEGMGVPADKVAEHYTTLATVSDYVVVLMSSAFGDTTTDLHIKPPLRHIATFSEEAAPAKFEPLPNASAQGVLEGPPAPKSDARIGGMVATIALIVLFALVGLMIWVGG